MRKFIKTTGRNKKNQVWYIGIDQKDKISYIIKWGQIGGNIQMTSGRPGSCGVKGHIDYQSPEEYVIFCMEREIRKKEEQGYVEYINNKPVKKVITSIDFSKPLPKNLCFNKPVKDISEKKLNSLSKKNKIIWTLKRDGMMHIAVKAKGIWEIYTRRMDLATDKFPHIVNALNELKAPNNSIFLGEMVYLKLNRLDDFVSTSRICRSDVDLALAYQGLGKFPKDFKEKNILGKMRYYVFDVAFLNSKDIITTYPVSKRLELLTKYFSNIDSLNITTGIGTTSEIMDKEWQLRSDMLWNKYIAPLQIIKTNVEEDLELAKSSNIEGFVILNIDAKYGDKAYSFDGKAQRPDGVYKRKPKWEEEFIISDVYEGSGKNRGKLGGFFIEQIHPKTGDKILCGKCGGGFSDKQREDFWNKRNELIGNTIKIEFDSRQLPKNGSYALRFPVFKYFSDKVPNECIAQFLGLK